MLQSSERVAFTIGHAFTGLTTYPSDDHVMGHILRFARRTGFDTVTIDLVKAEGGPAELLAKPISDVPARYSKWFWEMVKQHRSDRSLMQGATLRGRYDLTKHGQLLIFLSSARAPWCATRVSQILAARTFWPTSTVGGGRSDLSTSLVSHARGGDSGGRVGRQISWSCGPAEEKIWWSGSRLCWLARAGHPKQVDAEGNCEAYKPGVLVEGVEGGNGYAD